MGGNSSNTTWDTPLHRISLNNSAETYCRDLINKTIREESQRFSTPVPRTPLARLALPGTYTDMAPVFLRLTWLVCARAFKQRTASASR